MAQCVRDEQHSDGPRYLLTLTPEEADLLWTLTANVAGNEEAVRLANSVSCAFRRAGELPTPGPFDDLIDEIQINEVQAETVVA